MQSSPWTGNICSTCGSHRMIRSGTCECCQDCGTTTGCSRKRGFVPLVVLALALSGCASAALAKKNLTNVKGEVAVLQTVDTTHSVRDADAIETAKELVSATSPLQQVIHLGFPEELAQENLTNLGGIIDDQAKAGVGNVDRNRATIKVGEDLADAAAASSTIGAAGGGLVKTLTGMDWEGIGALLGYVALLLTGGKTALRVQKKRKEDAAKKAKREAALDVVAASVPPSAMKV